MRLLSVVAIGAVWLAALEGAAAQTCTRQDFAKAVNGAGAALRRLNAENAPRLQEKMRQLKTKMGWPDAGYEEKAFQLLQDERIASLDAVANDRLARIDALGTIAPSAEPDCSKLQALEAASLELQATVKTKANYMLARLDQMLGGPPPAEAKPAPVPAPKPKTPAKTQPPTQPDRAAKRVAQSGKIIQLEAMPAMERRIVHLALAEHDAVRTQSVGVEPNRRVVILPANKVG